MDVVAEARDALSFRASALFPEAARGSQAAPRALCPPSCFAPVACTLAGVLGPRAYSGGERSETAI